MNALRRAALLSACLIPPLPALADPPSNYWGAHAGGNDLGELHARVVYSSGTVYDGKADLARGPHAGVQLGRSSGHARYELEYETGRLRLTHLAVGPISAGVDARGKYQAAFANVYRTVRFSDKLTGFAGAGIGWGRMSLPHLVLHSACTCYGPSSGDGFAWQVRSGLGYRVTDSAQLVLQATWLNLPGPHTDGPPSVHYQRTGFGAWSLGWLQQF